MSDIFNDILSDKDRKEVNSRLYNSPMCLEELREAIEDSKYGLDDLMLAVTRLKYSCEDDNINAHRLKISKSELDKIALLIERFVNNFKPIYEEISAKQVMATLAEEERRNEIPTSGSGSLAIDVSHIRDSTVIATPNAPKKTPKKSWRRKDKNVK